MTASRPFVDIAKSVGVELKRLREARNITQVVLAARLQSAGMETGSSSKTVSAWERGETPLPLTALPPLAAAFRMEPGALVRHLGLCDDTTREIKVAEGADALAQLTADAPDLAESIFGMLRKAREIARSNRLERTN